MNNEYRAEINDLTQLAGEMRRRNNNMLSTIYTQIEAVLGDNVRQSKGLKDLVKWEVWRMTDNNQDYMYKLFRGDLDTTKEEPQPSKN